MQATTTASAGWWGEGYLALDASRSSLAYQDNAPVQPDALLSNMIIKY